MSVGQQFIKDKGYSNKTQVRLRVAPTRKQTHVWQKSRILFSTLLLESDWLELFFSFSYRSKYFPQEVRRLCSSSSSATGGTKTRPRAPVRPTPLDASQKWIRCLSMPPACTPTRPWQPSTAWWMMERERSRYECGNK